MPVNLPTETEDTQQEQRRKSDFPADGDYEVLAFDTVTNEFTRKDGTSGTEDVAQLTLISDDTGETALIKYRYEITENGKLKLTKGAGRLRTALDAIGIEGWDLEGKKLTMATTTFNLPGRDGYTAKDGTEVPAGKGLTYDLFLPTAVAAASAAPAAKGKAAAAASSYNDDVVGEVIAMIGTAGDEGISHASLFKQCVNAGLNKKDANLFKDLAANKAKLPGVRKDGQTYFLEG